MFKRLAIAAAARLRAWWWIAALASTVLLSTVLAAGAATDAEDATVLLIERAYAQQSVGAPVSFTQPARVVMLPDDWSSNWPRFQGIVLYSVGFDRPPVADRQALLALYVERACSTLDVYLNGQRVFSGGRLAEPVTRNCQYPQLISLPSALLRDSGNRLDLQVRGQALERVASSRRAGGLSALKIGPQAALESEYEARLFWNVTSVQIASVALTVMGAILVGLGWMHRREAHLGYLGLLSLSWVVLSMRVWWQNGPWDTGVMEFLICTAFAPLVAFAVQFLLSFADLRSRVIENVLAAQWVLVPATLLLAGPDRLFMMSSIWYTVLGGEVLAAVGLYLTTAWRRKRGDFWIMSGLFGGAALAVGFDLATQHGLIFAPATALLQFAIPILIIVIAARLLQAYSRALQSAEVGRTNLQDRVQEVTAEIQHNFAQLAELRVEQVTEKERKRIAADLHDDLGAKLLTIVHTSDSERISTLAREALEEMRLSVRGLTGKAMRLDDAMADWRAETVLRLGQANIEVEWHSPVDDTGETLPARSFVQTTRILRESINNIIKHSGASQCAIRCAIDERDFGLTIQDNGKGIPMELDGRLDRGHGMSGMKHRAKQMQGQCLVESGPGYGTVIRLTLPL